jgi:hypothetical protein
VAAEAEKVLAHRVAEFLGDLKHIEDCLDSLVIDLGRVYNGRGSWRIPHERGF